MLDSLGTPHGVTARNLKDYLIAEAEDKHGHIIPLDSISAMNAKGIPEQSNFCDCGLYLLGYMEKFLDNPRGFVKRILTRDFGPQDYWASLDPPRMRNEMRAVLQELEREQRKERLEIKRRRKETKRALGQGFEGTTAPSSSPQKPQAEELAPGVEQGAANKRTEAAVDRLNNADRNTESILPARKSGSPVLPQIHNRTTDMSNSNVNRSGPLTKKELNEERTPIKETVTLIVDTPVSQASSSIDQSPSRLTRHAKAQRNNSDMLFEQHVDVGRQTTQQLLPSPIPKWAGYDRNQVTRTEREVEEIEATKNSNPFQERRIRGELERSVSPPVSPNEPNSGESVARTLRGKSVS